jgi:two-component sensor histidine kinase
MAERIKPSLRTIFALAFAVIGLLATMAVAVLVSQETSERLRRDIGADLAELATHMADKLDRGMFERWRDIQVAASLDTMRDPAVGLDAKRSVIDQLRATYPDYAAIAFIGPDAQVKAATIPQMQGVSVADREFFLRGREAPFVGDVHDALLLAKVLGNDPANPPRFVDVVAPVKAKDGTLVGVIGAHLYWAWAEEIEQTLRAAAGVRYPNIDVLILAQDGTVLLGPKDLQRKVLQTASAKAVRAGEAGSQVEQWLNGMEYLTGYKPTTGYRDYPGLGWSVLVRQTAEASFAPVGDHQKRIVLWGLLVAGVTAALGWFAAGLVAHPLRALVASAQALGRGERINVSANGPREVGQVAYALMAASRELKQKDERQALLINELNHRVKNTLATIQSMATLTARSAPNSDVYKEGLEARIIALSKTHDLLTAAAWETVSLRDLLKSELAPYDDGTGQRVHLDGPVVPLAPRVAVALGMAAHELATNAAKHGSLSQPEGRVHVQWEVEQTPEGTRLHLTWKESGGPQVVTPSRTGFGSRLLQKGVARDLNGDIHLDFAVEGLGCRMLVALDEVGATTQAATPPNEVLIHRSVEEHAD